jgi:hypothetical protein
MDYTPSANSFWTVSAMARHGQRHDDPGHQPTVTAETASFNDPLLRTFYRELSAKAALDVRQDAP